MGKLSSFLDDLGSSYLESEMGLDKDTSVKDLIREQKYCPNCGKEIELNSTICYGCGMNPQKIKSKKYCLFCGNSVNEEQVLCLNCKRNIENTIIDNASGAMKVLCFLFPIIGLVIYLANINTRKQFAKDCGNSSLCGFIVGIVLTLIFSFVLFVQ